MALTGARAALNVGKADATDANASVAKVAM